MGMNFYRCRTGHYSIGSVKVREIQMKRCISRRTLFALCAALCIMLSGCTSDAFDTLITGMFPDTAGTAVTGNPVETIPGDGGEVSGSVRRGKSITEEYTFTPEKTGFWLFNMLTHADGNGDVTILEADGNSIGLGDGLIIVYLQEKISYTVKANIYAYSAGSGESYTLTVSLAEAIPSVGGEVHVSSRTAFSFTPDRTGAWTFRTSDNGDSAPYLLVRDSNNHNHGEFVHFDSGSDPDNSALLTLQLDEGTPYMIETGLVYNYYAPCNFTLTVSPAGAPLSE